MLSQLPNGTAISDTSMPPSHLMSSVSTSAPLDEGNSTLFIHERLEASYAWQSSSETAHKKGMRETLHSSVK